MAEQNTLQFRTSNLRHLNPKKNDWIMWIGGGNWFNGYCIGIYDGGNHEDSFFLPRCWYRLSPGITVREGRLAYHNENEDGPSWPYEPYKQEHSDIPFWIVGRDNILDFLKADTKLRPYHDLLINGESIEHSPVNDLREEDRDDWRKYLREGKRVRFTFGSRW